MPTGAADETTGGGHAQQGKKFARHHPSLYNQFLLDPITRAMGKERDLPTLVDLSLRKHTKAYWHRL